MMKSIKAQDSSSLKVSVYWGDILYDTAIFGPDSKVTVGLKQDDTFIMDLEEGGIRQSLELVTVNKDNTATVRFDENTQGHIRFAKEVTALRALRKSNKVMKDAEGIYTIQLSEKDKADIAIGNVTFFLDWAKERTVIPISHAIHSWSRQLSLGLIFATLLTIGLLHFFEVFNEELPPERVVEILSAPLPKSAPAKAAMGVKKTADGGSQKGEIGKADVAIPAKPSSADQLRSANLGDLAKDLSSIGNTAPGSVKGKSSHTTAAAINQVGTGGFSTEGLKTGGGGNSVGIGRTIGQGEGGFEGTGKLGLSGNAAIEGGTGYGKPGSTVTEGGLDRDVIDAIVRRRQDRVRLCYERQLNFFPKLSGKVSVQFIINAGGAVVGASLLEDTMKNAAVNQCLLSEVKTWTFPQPRGGTIVKVDYPFVFESSAKGP